ncbi:MAG: biotin--[acetyl-CoA-carboxylase] ligase [Nitrospirae bacterium CG_4_10_14_0_8_um_filter_41_23]|nr:biotin--[acetyl-CoA-carboxylase] ligase [Nitrospirota bacterium]OIP59049.1 MAG: biotin--[acetyl-CoA-carboxylase] ligase [Nitrospirae bacterium CG2_30_41_42]PIQ93304.1 MAG: biotin--[acetyl-CoA-carboxylase] ligase [Nitrospirae bacterium CG11_big_fil_rev_8_21_14_0_20_41_14]PIV41052.1 MAG: biotin--[acetyl-CoA-carboxylase] ligase [Nitrospirae bacterium CG02_land_8_20_14_3_00_41_53]PIW87433.1 MAG: biotin--[acetyl-CoA-carboxylase] ligase [Nitrospirae bacterium CG_4_8_14_3_um_filter_41_47]PIY86415.
MEIEHIKEKIKGDLGREIFFYKTVGSTNVIAAELAEKGAAEGVVVLADSQEKGKGRLGRFWISPPGVNIYMSIITRPAIDPEDATLLTVMTAVGCTIALRRVTSLNVTIKWPNDLMVSDKKIGGILTEMKTYPAKIIFAIVGIGINVNIDIDVFPDDVRKTATSIKNETGILSSRAEITAEILNEIDRWYRILKGMGKKILLTEWQRLTSTLGREVKVTIGKETFIGLAESLDDKGRLILRLPSGELKRVSTGDLTILR